jgi:SpoVK/Ycf46/Vps4 family AAA+-type ATPase
MTAEAVIAALARALQSDPRNGPLWLHYAQLCEDARREDDALAALRTAVELGNVREQALRRLVPLLRRMGHLAEALIRAEAFLAEREDPAMRAELAQIEDARAGAASAEPDARAPDARAPDAPVESDAPAAPRTPALREVAPAPQDPADWASQFDWGELRVTLADVAGLEEVKRQIRLRILAPMQNPQVYEAFGRAAGGGILLYGPPGCGKTYIARATAGELGARFVSVSLHEVVDKYWGESEKLIHGIFANARRNKPTVVFFDEFDALAGPRGRSESQFWRTLVDQLLQEMDGIGGRNQDVLLLAATNVPWNVDSAFRRPGRFDRVLFVTPPDEAARRALLERALAALPGGKKIDVTPLVRRTELFSGADLRALCERAAEAALERSLATGTVHEVSAKDFESAAAAAKSTVLEWLATAKNHARYANEGGQYDELAEYLKRIKKW